MIRKLKAPAWAVIEYGWYPLLVFITTPYLLSTLGVSNFGFWMLLTASIGFGSVLNTGTGAATIKQISSGLGRSEAGVVSNVISKSLAVGLAGGGLLSLLIFLVFWLGGDLFFAKMGNSSLIFITGVVAALLTWVEQIDNIFSSALRGAEKFGYAASLEIVGKTTQMLFAVFAVWIWGGLGVLYTALLLGAFLKLISKAYFVIKIFSLKSLCPSFNSAHALVHNAKWGWLQGMGGLFFGVADRMLVGSFLGASSLAHYSIATQLAQQIHALCAASFSVIFPKVSRKLEGDKNFSLWRITKFLVVANFVIGTFLGLLLLIFGKKIMVLWLGQIEAEACADVLLYLIIAYWILAINVVPYYLLLSLGKVRFIGQVCIISGLLSIFTMYLAMQNYGLIGAALGRVVYATFTLSLIYPLMQHLRHHRKISLRI